MVRDQFKPYFPRIFISTYFIAASSTNGNNSNATHSRNSSIDFLINVNNKTHSRKSSYEILSGNNYAAAVAAHHYASPATSHSRNQSLDLKQMKTDLGILLNNNNSNNNINNNVSSAMNSNNSNLYASNSQIYQTINQTKEATNIQVNIITGHHNWIAVAHPHFVTCYKMKDGIGWQLVRF